MSEPVKKKILPEIVVSTTLEFKKEFIPLNVILEAVQKKVNVTAQVDCGGECNRVKFSMPVDIVENSPKEVAANLEKIIGIVTDVSAVAILAKLAVIDPAFVANLRNRNERSSRNQRQTHCKGS